MPVKPCALQPFEGTQQFEVPFGTNIAKLTRIVKAQPDWILEVCKRPFVPLYGVKINADGVTYDFAPSTKGREQIFIDIATALYTASKDYVEDIVGGTAIILESSFPDYTYRKIGASECLQRRYYEVYNKARQFFTLHAAIPAYTAAVNDELTNLTAKIMRETDKQMMIMPGLYLFAPASPVNVALEAWFAADATVIGLYGIELITT